MTHEEMRKFVWKQTLLITTEKKTKFRDGKFAAYKEMWEALGGDKHEAQSATTQELLESGL